MLFSIFIYINGLEERIPQIRWMPLRFLRSLKDLCSTEVLLALVQIFVCFLTTMFTKFTSGTSNYISIQRKAHFTANSAKLRKRYYHAVSLLRIYLFHFHKTHENIYYYFDIANIFSFIPYFFKILKGKKKQYLKKSKNLKKELLNNLWCANDLWKEIKMSLAVISIFSLKKIKPRF